MPDTPKDDPGTTIPVEKWIPWIKSDHPLDRPSPLYRSDLTPAERSEFDEKQAARRDSEEKRRAKAKPKRRRPRDRSKPKPEEPASE